MYGILSELPWLSGAVKWNLEQILFCLLWNLLLIHSRQDSSIMPCPMYNVLSQSSAFTNVTFSLQWSHLLSWFSRSKHANWLKSSNWTFLIEFKNCCSLIMNVFYLSWVKQLLGVHTTWNHHYIHVCRYTL